MGKVKPRLRAKPKGPRPACERCLNLVLDEMIHVQAVMPVPEGARAPLARDGSGRCCKDCQSADTLAALSSCMTFEMARVAVANDRMEQLRLPEGARPHFGLVKEGLVNASEGADPLTDHLRWLDEVLPGWCTDEGPKLGTEDDRGRVYHLPDAGAQND